MSPKLGALNPAQFYGWHKPRWGEITLPRLALRGALFLLALVLLP